MKKNEFFSKNRGSKSTFAGKKLGRTKTKDFQYEIVEVPGGILIAYRG